MKKILSLILCALLLFGLCACKEGKSDNSKADVLVENFYNDFLAGKTTAEYGSEDVSINHFIENSEAPQYALFDRNGDNIPELCVNNGYFITTFWVIDNKLAVWREESYKMQILSNGNALQQGNGGAPNHFDCNYTIYSYTGEVVCEVYLSHYPKNDIEVLKDEYYMNTYVNDGIASEEATHPIEISKEQYDKRTEEILGIGKADIDWKIIY